MPNDTTDNHRIEKPPEGDRPWTQAYHNLADVLEVTAEIRDRQTAMSDYHPKSGALFRGTDSGEVYRGTGTEWVRIDLRVADFQAGNVTMSSGTVSSTPTDDEDIANKEYVDENTGNGNGGGAVDSVFGRTGTVEAESGDYTAEQVGALSESGGTVTGQTTIDSGSFEDHLRLTRSGVGDWMLTPTTNAGDALGVYDYESGLETNLSTNGYWEIDNDRTVMTNQGGRMDVQDTFPTSPSEGDVCIRTDEDLAYYFDGSSWNPFSYGSDGNGDPPEPSYTIDDFERGNLNPYDWPSSSGTRTASTAAAYDGEYGLEMNGYGIAISLPGMGLDNYPREGVPFEVYLRFLENTSSQYWIYLCPKGTDDPHAIDQYTFEVLMDDYSRIYKDRGSVNGEGTGVSSNAAAHIDWQTNAWYRFEILLDGSSGVYVDVYDDSTDNQIGYIEAYDTEHIEDENGIGFRCGGSGQLHADEIQEI